MARLSAVLRALASAVWRDQKTAGAIATNNFFWATALLLQRAGTALFLVLGLILLFPMSADPLHKIPRERLEAWPLSRRERRMLRLLSPWVNPVTWLMAGLVIWAAREVITVGLLGFLLGLFAAGFLLSFVPAGHKDDLWRLVPVFPGVLGQLIRKNIRDMVSTLDFYMALLLSGGGLVYGWSRGGEPEARMVMAILVVLAMSSYAQCLFGFDGESGFTRYHLLPLRGWHLLAAKDAAFLAVVVPLTVFLAPAGGLAAALVALAVGHDASVREKRPQVRWRFSTGASIASGIAQVFLLALAGVTAQRNSVWIVAPCALACAGSAWWHGRKLEQVDYGAGRVE